MTALKNRLVWQGLRILNFLTLLLKSKFLEQANIQLVSLFNQFLRD